MKLDQLTYFLETAKQEHIGKASRILAISPSAISHSISSLEEELGYPLFVKKGKNILLTNQGRLLMERAAEILQRTQAIKDDLTSDKIELQGHFRLAATHVLSTHFLAPSWIEIQNKNPLLTGEIYTLRSAQVYAGVLSGELQLGLCFSPQSHPDLSTKEIATGHLQAAVKHGHPVLDLKPSDRPRGLNNYRAALPKAFQGIEVCEAHHPIFQKFGIKPQVDFIFDSYEIAIEKVASSLAWGFFPDVFLKWSRNRISGIGPIEDWSAPYSISLIWVKQRFVSRVLLKLIESLERSFDRGNI